MFTYFIPLTVNLTKNSKLEKFVLELNALWKLSGSSMGALRELVAVAGMIDTMFTCCQNYFMSTRNIKCVCFTALDASINNAFNDPAIQG
jgi:hypothetical protein